MSWWASRFVTESFCRILWSFHHSPFVTLELPDQADQAHIVCPALCYYTKSRVLIVKAIWRCCPRALKAEWLLVRLGNYWPQAYASMVRSKWVSNLNSGYGGTLIKNNLLIGPMLVRPILKNVNIGGLNYFIWKTIPCLKHPDRKGMFWSERNVIVCFVN